MATTHTRLRSRKCVAKKVNNDDRQVKRNAHQDFNRFLGQRPASSCSSGRQRDSRSSAPRVAQPPPPTPPRELASPNSMPLRRSDPPPFWQSLGSERFCQNAHQVDSPAGRLRHRLHRWRWRVPRRHLLQGRACWPLRCAVGMHAVANLAASRRDRCQHRRHRQSLFIRPLQTMSTRIS